MKDPRCQSCEVLNVNGIRTREHGCPEAWRDETRECKECGCEFAPDNAFQVCCDEPCARAFAGLPNEDEDEDEFTPVFDYLDGADCGPEAERPARHG